MMRMPYDTEIGPYAASIGALGVAVALSVAIAFMENDIGAEELTHSKYEDRFIQLDKEALDEAYKKHVMRLYDIWVTDYNPNVREPPRAVRGAKNGRAAYEQAMRAIEERERK